VNRDSSDEQVLFDHLIREFGERGSDAVAFLRTAQTLVQDGTGILPRQAGAAAFCLREALKRLLPPEPDVFGALSDEVLKAKTRFDSIRGLPGSADDEALDDVLSAIAQLEDFKKRNEGKNVRRLAGLLESRTGTAPFPFALQQYQQLLRHLDSEGVHGSVSIVEVREFAARAMDVLLLVFGPFEVRQPELESLAQLEIPGAADVGTLLSICSGPHHLAYFMRRAVSPGWLQLLTPSGLLDPPQMGGLWPVLILLERLAQDHGPAVAAWLDDRFESWGKTEAGAAYIATGARYTLPASSRCLLRALRKYPTSQWIRNQAVTALGVVDPSSEFAERLAGVLLEVHGQPTTANFAEEAAKALVEGLDGGNALTRILILTRGLTVSSETRLLLVSLSQSGSMEQIADEEGRESGALLKTLLAAIRRSRDLAIPTAAVLEAVETLPAALRTRMRVWILRQADDVSPEEQVQEIAAAILDRRPTGEDVLLIDLITSATPPSTVWAAAWRGAMGVAPSPEEVGKVLGTGDVPAEWRRVRLWYPILPSEARNEWDTTIALMSPTLPAPGRDVYLEAPKGVELQSARSPFVKADLQELGVNEAARKIATWRPTADHMTLARELGRTLEELVSDAPRRWAENPLETLALLRHPTYVNHYFIGLTKTSADLSGLGPQVVEAINVAMTHPWAVVVLGGDDFDFDPSWDPVDRTCIDLIGRLAERNVDLGARSDSAWAPVLRAVRDRSKQSAIARREDPLETAINRPCTRALEAMFHLMGADFRRDGLVRDEALTVLDEALELVGWDGAEHRAVIAPRLAFLLHIAADWVEKRDSVLLGDSAPEDLGQRTLETALKWGRPNGWLFERHRPALLRAVRARSERAIDHLMVAMLWKSSGYSVSDVVELLVTMDPEVVSNASGSLARMLAVDEEPEHLKAGIGFWQEILERRALPAAAFRGFGWWAAVSGIDNDLWEALTLTACERAKGGLALSHKVAERCASEPVTATGLGILARLLRGQHEYWDRAHIAEIAISILTATREDSRLSVNRDRLRAALNDYGYFEA